MALPQLATPTGPASSSLVIKDEILLEMSHTYRAIVEVLLVAACADSMVAVPLL